MYPQMTIKETKLRIDPDLDQWLTSQSAIAGIAKTKYITQVLESHRVTAAHTHPQQSPKLSPNVSPSSSDLVTRIAAMEVRLTKVEQSTPSAIPKTIPSDTPKFYKGQAITRQSSKLSSLVWDSLEVKQMIGKSKYYLSNKLGIICAVSGVSRGGKTKLEVWQTLPRKVVLNPAGEFLYKTERDGKQVLQWDYEELAPLEPITPVEPAKIEIPIEVPVEAPSPVDEAVEPIETSAIALEATTPTEVQTLSRGDLSERLGKTPKEIQLYSGNLTNIGGVKMKATTIMTWTSSKDPDGLSWMPTDATRETWVSHLA